MSSWEWTRGVGALGAWWGFGAVVLGGLALAAAGSLLGGGVVLAGAFAGAALWRLRAAEPSGLAVRDRRLDAWFYAAFAVNVLGAVLLVERLMHLSVLAVADAVLLVVGVAVLLRPASARP